VKAAAAACKACPLAKHALVTASCVCYTPAHLSAVSPARSALPHFPQASPPSRLPTHFCVMHSPSLLGALRFFISDAEIADGFADTSLSYFNYTDSIKRRMRFKNSAPHFMWGLYFFSKHNLRERCAVAYVAHSHSDFTLGRMVKLSTPPTEKCRCRGPSLDCRETYPFTAQLLTTNPHGIYG